MTHLTWTILVPILQFPLSKFPLQLAILQFPLPKSPLLTHQYHQTSTLGSCKSFSSCTAKFPILTLPQFRLPSHQISTLLLSILQFPTPKVFSANSLVNPSVPTPKVIIVNNSVQPPKFLLQSHRPF